MLLKSDICKNRRAVDLLRAIPFEFDLVDYDSEEGPIVFEPAFEFAVIAGDYSGGTYVICEDDKQNPAGVFHLSSDAVACRIGDNLKDAIEHIVTMPNWSDAIHKDLDVMRERAKQTAQSDWTAAREAAELKIDIESDHTARFHHSLSK